MPSAGERPAAASRRSKPITTSSSRACARVALVGQLDEDGTAVGRVLPPLDEPALLEPVEVPRQRRALDPDGAGEVVLGAPGGRLQVREHEPRRNRAAGLGECVVEGAANRLGRLEEPEPERGRRWGASSDSVSRIASQLIIRVLIIRRRTIRIERRVDMSAMPLMHETWGGWPWLAPLWILLWIVVIATVIRLLAPARWQVVRAASRRRPRAAGDPGRPLRARRDRRLRVPGQAGHTPSVV